MYKKILIPTDGSPLSTAAAHAGIALARPLGAEIVGVTIVPEYQYPLFLDMIPPDYPDPDEQKAARQKTGETYLKEIEKAAADAGLKFSNITAMSDATAQQIVATAEDQHCDLIFMGSHGRSGWSQLLLGSVTAKVLAICQIPVLVYRSKQETSPA
ncbi:MAG: universal stress protein [Burkholderiaceae bacterium]